MNQDKNQSDPGFKPITDASSNPASMALLMASFAAFERERMRERMRAAKA
jgi:DNA invertase Pin-like site-specific DNA recombinase